MSRKTEIVTAAGALSCAIGIGFLMQSSEVAELRYGTTSVQSASALPLVGQSVKPVDRQLDIEMAPPAPLTVQSITLTSAEVLKPKVDFDASAVILAALDTKVFDVPGAPTRALDDMLAVETEKLPDCPIHVSAEQQAAAMVSFSIEAPCFAGQAVVISHEDLIFSTLLSDAGHVSKAIPALKQNAQIRAFFTTGQTATASVEVESLPLYDRVVVQWRGAAGVQIHAREFGAAYGDEGHVWSGADRDFSALASGHGGYMTSLGDASLPNGRVAEVYTFPTALSKTSGAVDLTIETEVTDLNCGRDINAHALQFIAGKNVSSQELTLSVPDCDAIGSFLVLNNLLQNLTVAHK